LLENAARAQPPADGAALATLVREQVQASRRHIDWHLARSRVAASAHLPGQRTALQPVVEGLVRVMNKVHADRALDISVAPPSVPLFFAGEAQDLQEMLGNLLDNACKWARSAVRLQVQLLPAGSNAAQPRMVVAVEDDGPGIDAAQRAQALERGVRLDEAVPGTGLGLAIVQELATLYGGRLDLQPAGLGGLRAALTLPAAISR
jgi:signal transduction histidine kinase